MGTPITVAVDRSGFIESEHLVDVAVVDPAGKLVASAGEPHRPASFRSCAKPIQARVCLENGWQPDERSLAIACASHNGEPDHVERVLGILDRAGLVESRLRCPPDVPADPEAALLITNRRRVYHYCSGKHAAMLATCSTKGWDLDSYFEKDHPLQIAIRSHIESLTGRTDAVLTDGCGVPTFAAPLSALASAFRSIDDGGPEAAAMRANPFLVAGTGQLDTDLMGVAPDLLVKYGAEGLVCASGNGYGIALKIRDGLTARSRGPATVLVLRALDLLDALQVGKLAHHAEPVVLGGGAPVGRARATGSLVWEA